ncbi:uncharacterized protein [Miscanthus floridulus]|uniref:uncharacterized protein n=1 Tax=Miscanthus floridulus TaxID=154761 RepID=UPI0034598D76
MAVVDGGRGLAAAAAAGGARGLTSGGGVGVGRVVYGGRSFVFGGGGFVGGGSGAGGVVRGGGGSDVPHDTPSVLNLSYCVRTQLSVKAVLGACKSCVICTKIRCRSMQKNKFQMKFGLAVALVLIVSVCYAATAAAIYVAAFFVFLRRQEVEDKYHKNLRGM